MSMNRRQFLKLASASTVLGVGGASVITGLGKGKLEASQMSPDPKARNAKRWGFVVDMSKLRTDEDYQKCIDACHSIHNVPNNPNPRHQVKWIWTDTYEHTFPNTAEDKYMNKEMQEKKFLLFCNHCQNPACVRVCPTQATFKRKSDGIVMQDMHRCIGCRFCMAACPFGARSFNYTDPRPNVKKPENMEYPTRMIGVVEKCIACYERLAVGKQPACVEASNGAIVFGDLEDPNSEVRKLIAEKYTIRRKPELGTQPSIYYVIGGGEHV